MKKLILFDVDGTLCMSGENIEKRWISVMDALSKNFEIGIIGGGSMLKIKEQLKIVDQCIDYFFCDNGLVFNSKGSTIMYNNLPDYIGNKNILKIYDELLKIHSEMSDDNFSSNFVKIKTGSIYYVPYGIDLDHKMRELFKKNDEIKSLRNILISKIRQSSIFEDYDAVLGGETGIAIYPKGWDKTYFLNYFDISKYEQIIFFGDKCDINGNDYPLTLVENINVIPVTCPYDTYDNCMDIIDTINY